MTTLTTGQVEVGTTATQIVPALTGRIALQLAKVGFSVVYLGADDTVSPATGFAWSGAAPLSLPITGALFGVVTGDEANATEATVSWASVGP